MDKGLKGAVRIEKAAESENGMRLLSVLDLEGIAKRFATAGVASCLSDRPTHYLCNEAYWHALQKFGGKAVLIHIPTIKYADAAFIGRVKRALDQISIR